ADVIPDAGRIRGHALDALRQALDALETRRTRSGGAERLDDGRLELRRQRGLQADHREARLAHAKRDLHAVGRVRVDDLAVPLLHEADGRDAVLVRAAPRREARILLDLLPGAVGGQVEAALLVDLPPQRRHLVAVAVD